ncbi:molybdopterin-binding protein [Pseudonocardiaceae bacterium YIM PH 21723]|nr:molybdopterin-binding protein [Pseudonocardiaceae bacterium YIM PH 21723]
MVMRLSFQVSALIAVLSAAAALATGHLVAGVFDPASSPFLAVGNTFIDLTPTPLKEFAVRSFGTADKLVLLVGIAVVLIGFALAIGAVSRRRSAPGQVLIGLLGIVGVIAVGFRPTTSLLSMLAPVVSAFIGVLAFRWLHARALEQREAEAETGGASRRTFLRSGLLVAAGAGVAGVGGQLLSAARDAESSRAAIGRIVPAVPAPPLPRDVDFHGAGTPTFLTGNSDFYRIDTALSVPQVRAEDWELRIHGMVDREMRFRFDDIRRRTLIERPITMTCVSNEVGGPYVSTSNFIGVPIRDLLMEAGVKPGADQVAQRSADGWTCGTPTEALLDEKRGAMLAIGMNGEPLPLEHGFPVRLVVPGLYGYVSATKWLVDMELTTWNAFDGYWVKRTWGKKGPIKTESRIDRPRGLETVKTGRFTVAGTSWAQPHGVDKVEVRHNGGEWVAAQLSTEVSGSTWRLWKLDLDLRAGDHRVEVRATDRTGYTQTEQRAPVLPDGATGWHSIFFSAA